MDNIDRRILRALQANGRLTNAELAQRVGLSASPCLRRVRIMEESGIITGYRAVVSPAAVGRSFEVWATIELQSKDRDTITSFEAALEEIPDVVEAHRLFGVPDYLLRVVVADIGAYESLCIERLTSLPGVTKINSQITMKRLKEHTGLPV
ncbi:Lrp/AsnC family transcriptional regulator [Longispora albida]|uniref:Lrp/AsnC family transcriptional regulator n=1 Tax=Longispora albida TaxID=203523 RepID=UPI000367069D|nr:Lrp/AsnC family transcriptional regulator [Longispora albida]